MIFNYYLCFYFWFCWLLLFRWCAISSLSWPVPAPSPPPDKLDIIQTKCPHHITPDHSILLHQYHDIIIHNTQPLAVVSRASWYAAMRGAQMTIILSMSNVDNICRSSIGQPDGDLIIMDMSWPDYCLLACSYCDQVCRCSHYELSQ